MAANVFLFCPPSLAASAGRVGRPASPLLSVREIFGISCLLLGAAMLLCQVDSFGDVGSAKTQADGERWVRTANGWERPSSWEAEQPARRDLHPLVVAAAQGLFSVLGLVAFSRGGVGRRSLCMGVCCHTVF